MKVQYLYKYKKLDQFSEKIFAKRELWFSNANDFNDPFEFSIPISFSGTDEQWREVWMKQSRLQNPSLSEEELNRTVDIDLRRGNHKDPSLLKQMEEAYLSELRKEINVCCFTKRNDDILMWSHYADYHRGICLEFNRSNEFFKSVIKVKYRSYFPKLNRFTTPPEEQTPTIVRTKHIEWEYEKERRLLATPGPHKFSDDCLIGVIFGCKMKNKDKDNIRNLLRDWSTSVQFYQAQKKNMEFGLDILKID